MTMLERIARAQPGWMKASLCRTPTVVNLIDRGKVDFFPRQGNSSGAAKQICAACPVRQECADYALARPELRGIWGGTSDKARKAARARARREAAA